MGRRRGFTEIRFSLNLALRLPLIARRPLWLVAKVESRGGAAQLSELTVHKSTKSIPTRRLISHLVPLMGLQFQAVIKFGHIAGNLDECVIHPAAAASLSSSARSWLSGTTNSVLPQFKQTNSSGKIQTRGFPRPPGPRGWMAISALNLPWLSDPQALHATDVSPCGQTTRDPQPVVPYRPFSPTSIR